MKILSRLGLLAMLLLVAASSTSAATAACASQPANPDGTTIAEPAPNAVVTSPFTIRGNYFGSFEGVVPIRILDASGTPLIDATTMNECCKLDPYESTVTFSVSAPTPACIVVYREIVRDGSLQPLAQIPVTLSPVATLPDTGTSSTLLLVGLALVTLCIGALLRHRPLLCRR